MSVVSGPSRAVYAAAVETLAEGIVRALTGANDTFRLADQLPPGDDKAGLAAVRVLGPDALAPFVLAGHRFDPDDAEVVESSIHMFPMSESGLGSDESGTPDSGIPVRYLRDWATGQVLARLGVSGFDRPYPAWAVSGVGRDLGWVGWAGMLAQLSPLASPHLECPIHLDAGRYRQDTARGVTRSLLRRDYLTTARLARWFAAGGDRPMDPPFRLEPVLRQLELVAPPDPRLLLEVMVTRCGWGDRFSA